MHQACLNLNIRETNIFCFTSGFSPSLSAAYEPGFEARQKVWWSHIWQMSDCIQWRWSLIWLIWRSLSWLIPHNVQFQQRDETVRELQGGSREVAFTKQLRCQLKVKSGRVFASLWPHNTEPILPSLSPNTPHNAYFHPPLCLLRNTKNGNLGYKKKSVYSILDFFQKHFFSWCCTNLWC